MLHLGWMGVFGKAGMGIEEEVVKFGTAVWSPGTGDCLPLCFVR